jgi:hypothetical protein
MLAAAHRDLDFVVARGIGRCGRGRAFGDSRLLGAREQRGDLLVGGLAELVVPVADRPIRSGTSSEMTSSNSDSSASTDSAAPTGTASTSRDGPRSRRQRAAARAVPPVARPSSTTITVLPDTSTAGRWPR